MLKYTLSPAPRLSHPIRVNCLVDWNTTGMLSYTEEQKLTSRASGQTACYPSSAAVGATQRIILVIFAVPGKI